MTDRPRLLQVCNVGRVVGGTAACAWTVTRALPGFDHQIVFRSPYDQETRHAFEPGSIARSQSCLAADISRYRPKVVLLHNTPTAYATCLPDIPTLQYRHSAASVASAHFEICCSRWLATTIGRPLASVLWQGVPRPRSAGSGRDDSRNLTVGRICTPTRRKWPAHMIDDYRQHSQRFPSIHWEFVGCPQELVAELEQSCRGRATFWPSGWEARRHLSRWHVLLYRNRDVTESFGRTVAESLRAGCIPIVDRQGGFIEQLSSHVGYLCEDAADVDAALAELHDSQLRRAMSQRAADHGNEHFSLATFARGLLQRFDEATSVLRISN